MRLNDDGGCAVGKLGIGDLRKRGFAIAALAAVIGLTGATGAAAQSTPAQTATPAATTGAASGHATIVVNGWGSASAPANGAIVQLIARQLGVADFTSGNTTASQPPVSTGAPTPPTKEQVKTVVDALVKAGVAKDGVMTAITLQGPFYGTFGQGTAVIAFQLNADQVKKTTKFVQAALKQGEAAGVSFDAINLVYTTNDCASVANAALAAAIADAHAQAEAMVPALHGQLGDLVQAVSQPSYGKSYAGGGGPNYCSQPASLEAAMNTYFSSFDANGKPEVEIYSSVSLTYALN